jgi:hypothetical protein
VPDRIALVSEWDTFYGRSLPKALGAVLCPNIALSDCRTVVQASYLQGIDGTLPGEGVPAPAPTSDSAKRDPKDQTKESVRSERADGRHQFDYLRRLADRLRQQNAQWKGTKGEIKAIGILGSDVYDKLLVLRALRSEFPQAQVFTTDLDARLLHPQEFSSTRNIVVASGYGLELRKELQGDIPPFRDSYQTALFYTTLLALASPGSSPTQEQVDRQMKPRIFEIGRRHAYDLDRDASLGKCDWNEPLRCETIHPEAMQFVPAWLRNGLKFYVAGAFLLLVSILPLYACYRMRTSEGSLTERLDLIEGDTERGIKGRISFDVAREILHRRRARALKWFAVTSLVLLPLLHLAAVFVLDTPLNQEPVTFYEGISVWPTEVLRIYAGVLAIFLTYWAMLRMETNQLELTGWFFPQCRKFGVPEFDFNQQGVWESIRANLNRASLKRIFTGDLLLEQPANGPNDAIKAEPFWQQCAFHSSLAASTLRSAAAALAFYAFALSLIWISGRPHTPYRGDLSFYVDIFAVIFWSTPLLLFLTFYVVDSTLVCKRFISALSARPTEWPDDTREYFGAPKSAGDLERAYNDWIDVQLIAQRTAAVAGLVYYPLLVMIVLLFARSSLFDNWHWPAALVVPLAISILIIASCHAVLRREAEKARGIAHEQIERRLLVAKGQGTASAALASQLELMLKNIEQIREGAFAPVTQQPLVKALLIFFSASGLAFLEYFGVISF